MFINYSNNFNIYPQIIWYASIQDVELIPPSLSVEWS